MSTQSDTESDDEDDRSLEELCRSISANDDYSEEIRQLTRGLLESIENGDIDAN